MIIHLLVFVSFLFNESELFCTFFLNKFKFLPLNGFMYQISKKNKLTTASDTTINLSGNILYDI